MFKELNGINPAWDSDVGLLTLIWMSRCKMQDFDSKFLNVKFFICRHFLETMFLEIFQRHLSLWSLMILSRVLVSKDVRRVPRAAAPRSQVRLLSNANFPLMRTCLQNEHLVGTSNFFKIAVKYESYKCNVS